MVLITEDSWMNSQLSIARHFGQIKINGTEFIIVDKHGRDLFECSYIAEKEGRSKAIEPGEPADLIDARFRMQYRKLGRERFIQILSDNPTTDSKEILKLMKKIIKEENL